jgi:hypothetical protein
LAILGQQTCFNENDINVLDEPVLLKEGLWLLLVNDSPYGYFTNIGDIIEYQNKIIKYIGDNRWIDITEEYNKNQKEEEKMNIELKSVLKDAINSDTITNCSIKESYASEDYLERTVEFSYYSKTQKSISDLAKAYQETAELLNNQNENETNKSEEETGMNMCEFEIGDVWVQKDNINNIFDGEAIIVAPGLSTDDFIINDGNNCINVIVIGNECRDCGEPKINEFNFMLNPFYKVKKKSRTMENGLLYLQVDYDVEDNIQGETF